MMAASRSTTMPPSARSAPSRSAARIISSPDPMPAAGAPPPSTRSSRPPSSTASTPKPICVTFSPASPITRSTASVSCCRGVGRLCRSRQRPRSPPDAYGVTAFTYDANGNITRVTRPNGAYLDYTYNDAKRVTAITDNVGAKIELGYDAMGNVTSRSIKDAANTVTFAHSQVFDELGRLLRSIGALSQTTTFTYDKTDNLKSATDPRSNVYAYAYDALSRLIQETTEDTAVINYGLDGRD